MQERTLRHLTQLRRNVFLLPPHMKPSSHTLLLALQERTSRYLEQLCAGTTLALSATRPQAAGARGGGGRPEIDKIAKTVTVRPLAGADGEVRGEF